METYYYGNFLKYLYIYTYKNLLNGVTLQLGNNALLDTTPQSYK